MVKITFLKSNQIIDAPSGSELIAVCKNSPIKFGCTRGECGVCAIAIAAGSENLTQCSTQETHTLMQKGLSSNHRLACQCAFNGDISIDK